VLGGCEYLLRRKTTGRRVSSASGWATAQKKGWLGGRAQATTPLSRSSAAARKWPHSTGIRGGVDKTRVSGKEETPRAPYVVWVTDEVRDIESERIHKFTVDKVRDLLE
jgi:hypothetical protein